METKEIKIQVKGAAKAFGVSEQEIVNRALLTYLSRIKQSVHLKQELEDWDSLSDEAISKFETANLARA